MTLTITVRLRSLPASQGAAPPASARAAAGARSRYLADGRPGRTGQRDGARQGRDGTGTAPVAAGTLGALLPLAEPAALLLAEAAGLGLAGRMLLATAFRSAQRALAG